MLITETAWIKHSELTSFELEVAKCFERLLRRDYLFSFQWDAHQGKPCTKVYNSLPACCRVRRIRRPHQQAGSLLHTFVPKPIRHEIRGNGHDTF